MAIEKKSKFWELPAKQQCRFGQFGPILRLDWQCCLAGSSKTAPRIFIFSIVLGAKYLSYVKSIDTHARALLPLNISAVGTVLYLLPNSFGPAQKTSETDPNFGPKASSINSLGILLWLSK